MFAGMSGLLVADNIIQVSCPPVECLHNMHCSLCGHPLPTAPAAMNVATDAMDHWKENTCIRFKLRTNETDYVRFTHTTYPSG